MSRNQEFLGIFGVVPPRSFSDNETVLYRQFVVWQSLQIPLGNRRVIHQHLDDVKVIGEWNLLACHLFAPGLQHEVTEFLIEGSRVGEETSGEEHVSDEAVNLQ